MSGEMIRREIACVLLVVTAAACGGLAPTGDLTVPSRVETFLAADGAAFARSERPEGAIDLPPGAVLVNVRELNGVDGFRGTPDAPVYGLLSCTGAPVCPSWLAGAAPVLTWLVWFPDAGAFVFVDAGTGQMLRAAVTIRGSGEWTIVL
jgi:hypothetical protein